MAGKSTTLAGAAIVMALVFALGTGVAGAAKGGNSANAKKCQKAGYLDWVDADGNAFANAGACTSYAAKGNELQPKPVRTWQSVCEDELDGEYVPGGEGTESCLWENGVTQEFVASADAALRPFCAGQQVFNTGAGGAGIVHCDPSFPPT